MAAAQRHGAPAPLTAPAVRSLRGSGRRGGLDLGLTVQKCEPPRLWPFQCDSNGVCHVWRTSDARGRVGSEAEPERKTSLRCKGFEKTSGPTELMSGPQGSAAGEHRASHRAPPSCSPNGPEPHAAAHGHLGPRPGHCPRSTSPASSATRQVGVPWPHPPSCGPAQLYVLFC